jgi:hypothetical protein
MGNTAEIKARAAELIDIWLNTENGGSSKNMTIIRTFINKNKDIDFSVLKKQ